MQQSPTKTPCRTLGIDLGSRRVGIALSDEGGKFATPLDVLQIQTPREAMDRVAEIIRKQDVRLLVVGIPINMDDSIGPQAIAAAEWGRELSSVTGKPVIFIDERLSSFAAEQSLIDRKRGGEKITRKGKKDRLDALAAAIFLQAYLDGKLPPLEMPGR